MQRCCLKFRKKIEIKLELEFKVESDAALLLEYDYNW